MNEKEVRLAALEILQRNDCSLKELTQAIVALESKWHGRCIRVGVSSSVTIDLLGIYLRRHGLLNGVQIDLVIGNYDDPIGDMELFKRAGVELIIIMPFFDNLLPSFEAQLQTLDQAMIAAKEIELRERYRHAFSKSGSVPVYVGALHRMGASAELSGEDSTTIVLRRFNDVMREEALAHVNVRLIDTEDIVFTVGRRLAFDHRFYFKSKLPYTGAFLNELASRIAAMERGFGTHFYKVLALDCDNTIWGGVVGEDFVEGIKLGPYEYPGNIFWRMQQEYSNLESRGILLTLVTKNNPNDIEEVFRKHPSMVLKETQIVAKRANWEDKPSSLRSLSKELNVGLDSFVFVDDSSFECESMREQLPMVKTIQVPQVLSEYPQAMAEIKSLFLSGGVAEDSKNKTAQYRQRAGSEEMRAKFQTQEEYLASLGLKVEIDRDAVRSSGRVSELSQKSNQFNLTTRRYTMGEIENMMKSEGWAVYSLAVSDKFGSAGLTGVVTIRYEACIAIVESFFISCRVIGRGIEMAIWGPIVTDARNRGCTEIRATYVPSTKNSQVADFFDRLGFLASQESSDGVRQYVASIEDFTPPINPWIEITYAR